MAASEQDIAKYNKYMAILNDPTATQSRKDMAQDMINKMEYEGYEKSKGMKCGGKVKKYAKGGEVDNDEKSKKPKRTAKDIVNRMEVKRMMPVTNAMLSGAEKVLDRMPEGGLRDLGVGVTTGAMVPTMLADIPISALRGTKSRTKEEEDELVREVRRTQGGYKKGGSVRGAGAATKGIRKCKIV